MSQNKNDTHETNETCETLNETVSVQTNETNSVSNVSDTEDQSTDHLGKFTQRMIRKAKVIKEHKYQPATMPRLVYEYLKCFNYLLARVNAGYRLGPNDSESKTLRSVRFRQELVKQTRELRMRVLAGVANEMKGTASLQAVELLTKLIDKEYGDSKQVKKGKSPVRGWDEV